MERFKEENEENLKESESSKLKEVAESAQSWFRNATLVATLGTSTLEHAVADQGQIEAKRDIVVKVEDLPKPVRGLIEEYKSKPDIVVTPQITLPKGDVVIHLAQVHADPHLKMGENPNLKEGDPTVKCQERIIEFIDEIEKEQKKGARVLYFTEGCSNDVVADERIFTNALNLYLCMDGTLNAEDIERMINAEADKYPDHFGEQYKYAVLSETLRLIKSNPPAKSDKAKQKLNDDFSKLIKSKLDSLDQRLIVYAGGMHKLKFDKKIYLQKTEDGDAFDKAVDIFVGEKYESEEMNKLTDSLNTLQTQIALDPESEALPDQKKAIVDAIEEEKQKIRVANMEDRENHVVKNIQSMLKQNRKAKNSRTIAVLNFGAGHDFHNNVVGQGMSLVRINMMPEEARVKNNLKN